MSRTFRPQADLIARLRYRAQECRIDKRDNIAALLEEAAEALETTGKQLSDVKMLLENANLKQRVGGAG